MRTIVPVVAALSQTVVDSETVGPDGQTPGIRASVVVHLMRA